MEMHCCESSSISEIGHDGNTLRVKYKHGGLYEFQGVTAEQFSGLKGAKSIGKHFHAMGLKPGEKVTEKR